MACCVFGTKSSPDPMLMFSWIDPIRKIRNSSKKKTIICFQENVYCKVSAKSREQWVDNIGLSMQSCHNERYLSTIYIVACITIHNTKKLHTLVDIMVWWCEKHVWKMKKGSWWMKDDATLFIATESNMSMVSCQKGPTRHAYAWQIGPFWQDTLDVWVSTKVIESVVNALQSHLLPVTISMV